MHRTISLYALVYALAGQAYTSSADVPMPSAARLLHWEGVMPTSLAKVLQKWEGEENPRSWLI